MRAVTLVALLGVAAAVPSSIRLKEATLLVQRPRQEGHAKNWNLEVQQRGQSALARSSPKRRLKAALWTRKGSPRRAGAEERPLRRSGACLDCSF